MMIYNKGGQAISMEEWARLAAIKEYQKVSDTTLPNGVRVSTVWLGLDHSFRGGKPLIFETMVFPPDSWSELGCRRYCTEQEAKVGHEAMVKEWLDKPVLKGTNDNGTATQS